MVCELYLNKVVKKTSMYYTMIMIMFKRGTKERSYQKIINTSAGEDVEKKTLVHC